MFAGRHFLIVLYESLAAQRVLVMVMQSKAVFDTAGSHADVPLLHRINCRLLELRRSTIPVLLALPSDNSAQRLPSK